MPVRPHRTADISMLRGINYESHRRSLVAYCCLGTISLWVSLTLVGKVFDWTSDWFYRWMYDWSWSPIPIEIFSPSMPDFAAIPDTNKRKKEFFDFLEPFIEEANSEIRGDRESVIMWMGEFQSNGKLAPERVQQYSALSEAYGFKSKANIVEQDFHDLLSRVDIVPPSLVLAQAAIESGWGTSRFAQEGNNLFGIWCYEPGCGMVPERRPQGRKYEVRKYGSPKDCFLDYIKNLNTNKAYLGMRSIRRSIRKADREPQGVELADGMNRYSQEGWVYVDKIKMVMGANDLDRFDTKHLQGYALQLDSEATMN